MVMSDEDKPATTQKAVLERARRDFKRVTEAEHQQRKREERALRFQIPDPEGQWAEDARKQRQGDGNTPARPMLCISSIDQPIALVGNQFRAADLGLTIHPISEKANQDTAEMIQGLIRRIETLSHADVVRYWSYDRAIKAGRGCYRVVPEYDPESDDETDQRLVIKRFLHQEAVYFDPAANEPDWSDGKFCFVIQYMTKEDFKAEYPGVRVPDKAADRLEWQDAVKAAPAWFDVEKGDVMVAEYWWKEYGVKQKGKHSIPTVRVHRDLLCGWDVLDSYTEPEGIKLIPIIPVVGRELQPVDSQRRFMGIIEPAMDPQRFKNFSASTVVEAMNAEPKAPWRGYPETIEGYEDIWNSSNRKNYTFLPMKAAYGKDGQLLPPPERVQVDSSKMQLGFQGLQVAEQWINSATQTFEPSLGKGNPKERSGRAIQSLQQQADASTSGYMRNFADISLPYEARVILERLPIYYDREERVVHIVMGDDKKTKAVMLNAEHVVHPDTKRPIATRDKEAMAEVMAAQARMQQGPLMGPTGAPAMPMPGSQQPTPVQPPEPEVKVFDLREGVYDVSVTVGKSFQTRLDEGSQRLGDFISADPNMLAPLGDVWARYSAMPQEVQERLKKLRQHTMPWLDDDEQGKPSADQMAAQVQQLQQQMQAMGQQMQEMSQIIKTKQIEAQGRLAVAQTQAAGKVQEAKIHQETAIAQSTIQASHDAHSAADDRMHEAIQSEADRQHEAEQNNADRLSEAAAKLLAPVPQSAGVPLQREELDV